MLKFPPIKQNSIPENLIYNSFFYSQGKKLRTSTMFDTKTGKRCALMCHIPAFVKAGDEIRKSLYITYIVSFIKNKGYGTKMLNFAKKISAQNDCNGYFHLEANGSLMPMKIPHIFYRKYGMNTGDKKIDKKLDKFIKKNKIAKINDFENIFMFYPQINSQKNEKFFQKLKKIFKFL